MKGGSAFLIGGFVKIALNYLKKYNNIDIGKPHHIAHGGVKLTILQKNLFLIYKALGGYSLLFL